jgi:hypothetical protein
MKNVLNGSGERKEREDCRILSLSFQKFHFSGTCVALYLFLQRRPPPGPPAHATTLGGLAQKKSWSGVCQGGIRVVPSD